MATPTTRTPVLDLSTVVQRPTIKIDGKTYELRTAEELPWLLYRGYAGTFQQAGALLANPNRTDQEDSALEKLLVPLVQAIVDAPKAVLKRLSNDQRWAVLTVFSQLLLAEKTRRRPAGAKTARSARPRASQSSTKTGVH